MTNYLTTLGYRFGLSELTWVYPNYTYNMKCLPTYILYVMVLSRGEVCIQLQTFQIV